MNERIKELALEVFSFKYKTEPNELDPGHHMDHLYKFAELIVRECAQYMYEHYPHSLYEINYMRKHMGDPDWNKPIRQHFGVE